MLPPEQAAEVAELLKNANAAALAHLDDEKSTAFSTKFSRKFPACRRRAGADGKRQPRGGVTPCG